MERLKSAVPAELRRAVSEGTAADLPTTTSRLLAFFDSLPLFHQVTSAQPHPVVFFFDGGDEVAARSLV
jgi:hypothetical protein